MAKNFELRVKINHVDEIHKFATLKEAVKKNGELATQVLKQLQEEGIKNFTIERRIVGTNDEILGIYDDNGFRYVSRFDYVLNGPKPCMINYYDDGVLAKRVEYFK